MRQILLRVPPKETLPFQREVRLVTTLPVRKMAQVLRTFPEWSIGLQVKPA